MRFEFTVEELERLTEFVGGRGSHFDDYDKQLLQKLRDYISQAESIEEVEAMSDVRHSWCRKCKYIHSAICEKCCHNYPSLYSWYLEGSPVADRLRPEVLAQGELEGEG